MHVFHRRITAWSRSGSSTIPLRKANSLVRHPVHPRSLDRRSAITTQVAIPQIIGNDNHNVRLFHISLCESHRRQCPGNGSPSLKYSMFHQIKSNYQFQYHSCFIFYRYKCTKINAKIIDFSDQHDIRLLLNKTRFYRTIRINVS